MDALPKIEPVLLSGLSWPEALSSLNAVDCALRRPHWCDPVVVLIGSELMLDSADEIFPLRHMPGDKKANDWMMVPRVDDDGNQVPVTYRARYGEPK